MGKLGFRCFTAPTPPETLTLKQQVRALTTEQKDALLTGFEQLILAGQLDHKLLIPKDVIQDVYDGIDAMQERSKLYMRGEVVITPAVYDTGFTHTLITPAVMNTPPTSMPGLRSVIIPEFSVDFTNAFISLVLDEMVKWSKYDGTGTFNFYENQIVL